MSIEEIKAREAAATEGPWEVIPGWVSNNGNVYSPGRVEANGGVDPWGEANDYVLCGDIIPADAEFIAHARSDIPKLLAALKAIDVYCMVSDMKASEIRSDKILQLVTEALR